MEMKLELVPIPVTDVDKSIDFYVNKIGFHLDHDVQPGNGMRIVQLTPPGSACSIAFGTGFMEGINTVSGLHLVVADVAAARDMLVQNGVEVSDVQDAGGGVKYAHFNDNDGNGWELQEVASDAHL